MAVDDSQISLANGLNFDAINAAIGALERAQQLDVPPLDPDFPYVCEPFNPTLFGLTADPNQPLQPPPSL